MGVTHLDEHPHAFLRDGLLITVAVFHGHDQELIELVRQTGGHDQVVCLCDYGDVPLPGSVWDGEAFIAPTATGDLTGESRP